jgi:hypothetical protein
MIVWKLTKQRFLAGQPQGSAMNPFDFVIGSLSTPAWFAGMETILASDPSFATAPIRRDAVDFAHQLLLHLRPDDTWEPVGCYMDDSLGLKASVQGRGLSTELILRCSLHRPVPTVRKMTDEGFGALARAHRIAVQTAVEAGLPVPAEVRSHYGL